MESENFKIIGVTREIVTIEIIDSSKFDDQFNIGSYVKIPYKYQRENFVIGVIKNYKIKNLDSNDPQTQAGGNHFIIEVELIGSYRKKDDSKYFFERGAHGIPLPPNNGIELVSDDDFRNIFSCNIKDSERFIFSKLAQNQNINVAVNGNKFFNKHFAIVGSTGSGKSHTVATILQQAIKEKSGNFALNNSHIVLFDIHGEYQRAFPNAHNLNIGNLILPYWLLNGEELEELFLDTEANDHNQRNVFKEYVVSSKKELFTGNDVLREKIHYDFATKFDIHSVLDKINAKNVEMVEGSKGEKQGSLYGKLTNFISRLENKINDKRLDFLLGQRSKDIDFEDAIKQLIGYVKNKEANITVIDLSGIPFEVLSITVSLISRILFEYGYYYKKLLKGEIDCETPLLLVYEEAHKYVPRSDLAKYRASKNAIERIAKEGRKYGVTLGIVSQRPSEISETIFSQCNNFISMRLTNPDDQNYVKRLLPDTMGDLTSYLSSLQSGEAIIIGESIILPSLVKINLPDVEPHSTDIKYLDIWKEKWKDDVSFDDITHEWIK